ncbi:MAG: ABC transporter ATP-binding protein [Bacteroidota bacterium]|nr:ABC transporter ATP-binding protein [Bacteroidota bacterium]
MAHQHSLFLENFSYVYPFADRAAFNNISFELNTGETLGIVGPSASGKTSLLYAIAGILQKHFPAGSMSGTILRDATKPLIAPAETGFVFQDQYMQLSGVTETVEAEIAFSLEQLGMSPRLIRERIAEQVLQFHLEHLALRHPRTLSGGETRMLAFACELAKHPHCLFLDQPADSLHAEGVQLLVSVLKARKHSTTVIVTDHRLEMISTICDKVLFLLDGNQKFFGTPAGLLTSALDLHVLDIPLWIDAQQKLVGHVETLSYREALRILQSRRDLRQWHSSNAEK